jgi:hypothetical protein
MAEGVIKFAPMSIRAKRNRERPFTARGKMIGEPAFGRCRGGERDLRAVPKRKSGASRQCAGDGPVLNLPNFSRPE